MENMQMGNKKGRRVSSHIVVLIIVKPRETRGFLWFLFFKIVEIVFIKKL